MSERIPKSEWETPQMWRQQIERRLFDLGAKVNGNLPIQADRIADVVEQIQELRKEVERISERQDKMADYIKANVKKNGGAT